MPYDSYMWDSSGLDTKDLIKAKLAAKGGEVKISHCFDVGVGVRELMFDVANHLLSISLSLETANDELLSSVEIENFTEQHDKAVAGFQEALDEMRKAVAHAG